METACTAGAKRASSMESKASCAIRRRMASHTSIHQVSRHRLSEERWKTKQAVYILRRGRLLSLRGFMECATFADVSDAPNTQPFAKEGGVEETNKYDGDGDKEKQVPEGSEIGKDEHAAPKSKAKAAYRRQAQTILPLYLALRFRVPGTAKLSTCLLRRHRRLKRLRPRRLLSCQRTRFI